MTSLTRYHDLAAYPRPGLIGSGYQGQAGRCGPEDVRHQRTLRCGDARRMPGRGSPGARSTNTSPAKEHRGIGGPAFVQPAPDPNPLAPATIKGAHSIGIPTFDSPNGQMMETNGGAAISDVPVRDGKRQSVFSFLHIPVNGPPEPDGSRSCPGAAADLRGQPGRVVRQHRIRLRIEKDLSFIIVLFSPLPPSPPPAPTPAKPHSTLPARPSWEPHAHATGVRLSTVMEAGKLQRGNVTPPVCEEV